ncbi:hypothetical protein [Streptomyces boncukensis]|uniref:Uncharacterized protein n=1 Tax=Streptomyces boncukensis TaxID=2711219 RepID=A0A6G4WRE7_9ACTN|nr:hypothetical protein [Streptomyces boncukensis]NGO67849.1 hypothetical protein [Streptomyces boncukensis]
MSHEQQQPERKSGCPPHEFGNALVWRWSKQMPRTLKGGFLTMLYALRAMVTASGETRFSGDGKPIRIQDIAKAAGCREQDARRYLDAAIRAGVVMTVGERRRGRPTVYRLLLCPRPDWAGAADYLKATARPRKTDEDDGSSGHRGTNSEGGEVQATEARTDGEEVRATEARTGSGHKGTNGSGHRGTNNPGVTQERTQEMAGVVPQPEERAGARAADESTQPEEPEARQCPNCKTGRIVRPDRDRCGGCLREAQTGVQGAFLLPLNGGGQDAPRKRPERVPWPKEDPTAPRRTCGCGREYRLRDSEQCPTCLVAAEEQRRELEAVRHG